MNTLRIALSLVAIATLASPAAAQFRPLTPTDKGNSFGDTKLAYQDGVVYDDDLVPGRSGSQSFLVGESGGSGVAVQSYRENPLVRPNSPNLIGRDGRVLTRR